MKLRLHFFISFSLLLFSLSLTAQSNYQPGIIIDKSNNKIKGFIDFRYRSIMPEKIYFKRDTNASIENYKPEDIAGFECEGIQFISAFVKLNTNPFNTNDLLENNKELFTKDSVFLEQLIIGDKMLYYLKDKDKREHFYVKLENRITELVHYKYLKKRKTTKTTRTIINNNKYRGQLMVFFLESPKLYKRINSLEYSKKALITLFESYYNSSKSNPIYIYDKTKDKFIFKFGLTTGVNITNQKYADIQFNKYELKSNNNHSIAPHLGISLTITSPKGLHKWSLWNEISFSSYENTSEYNVYVLEKIKSRKKLRIGAKFIKLTNAVCYGLNIGKFKFSPYIGISNSLVLSTTNEQLTYIGTTNEISNKKNAIKATRNHTQGYLLGVMIQNQKWNLNLSYEKTNGISNISTISTKTNSVNISVGYQI